jgi:hypothetical protein
MERFLFIFTPVKKAIMKKNIILTAVVLCATIGSAFSAVTIRYYNKDSKKHTMSVNIDGSKKEVTFSPSTSGSVTIQGTATTCKITTSCGVIEVKNNAVVEIKDGCIKVTQ